MKSNMNKIWEETFSMTCNHKHNTTIRMWDIIHRVNELEKKYSDDNEFHRLERDVYYLHNCLQKQGVEQVMYIDKNFRSRKELNNKGEK